MDQCGNQTSTTPEDEPEDCMGAVRNCIACVVPPSKDVLSCAGVPGRDEVLHMLDSLVDFVSGNMTDPAASQTFIRRAGYVAKEDSEENTVWAVKWPAGLTTAGVFDVSDRLYFGELSQETVPDIAELEKPSGVVVSVGGPAPNDLAMGLHRSGIKILGTSADAIDTGENRFCFGKLCDAP